MSPDDLRHGTPAGRHAHKAAGQSTCERCRRASARYEQELQLDRLSGRPRVMPALGTRRRIQALVALGYDFRRIGWALGIGQQGVSRMANLPHPSVYARTAARVESLYDAWSMTLPSVDTARDRRATTYARTNARRNGWLPPLAWDDIDTDPEPVATTRNDSVVDDVVVQRLLDGQVVAATVAEKREVVARWSSTGRPLADLARMTGWNVQRYHSTPDYQEQAS